VGVADTVWLAGRARVVVGLTSGSNLLLTQFVFGNLQTATTLSGLEGRASFIIVRLAPGSDARAVADTIRERFPETDVFDRRTFLANSRREAGAGYLPLFLVINLIGAAAAALLVSLLIHSLIEERRADLAVLLALGADAGALGRAVIGLAARLVLTGGLLGLVAAGAVSVLLDRYFPVIPLRFEVGAGVAILTLFGAAGILAAVIPVLRLRSIDPLEAFRP
jgi:ABC-type antimicrobial peptide transport system permease subunit